MSIRSVRTVILIAGAVGVLIGGLGALGGLQGDRAAEEFYCRGSFGLELFIGWLVSLLFLSFYALVCGMTGRGIFAVSRFVFTLQFVVVIPAFVIVWSVVISMMTGYPWKLVFDNSPSWISWLGSFIVLAAVIALYRYCRWLMLQKFFSPFAIPDDRAMAFWVFAMGLCLGVVSFLATIYSFTFCK